MYQCFAATYGVLLLLIPLTVPIHDFAAEKVATLRFAILAHMEELELLFRWRAPSGRQPDRDYHFKTNGYYLRVLMDAVRVAVMELRDAGGCITTFARCFNGYVKLVIQRDELFVPDSGLGVPFLESISRGLAYLDSTPFARLASIVGSGRALRHGGVGGGQRDPAPMAGNDYCDGGKGDGDDDVSGSESSVDSFFDQYAALSD